MARLWIDAWDYAADLLRSGADPWQTPGEIGLFCAEAVRLLHADRLFLPLWPCLAAEIMGDNAQARADALDDAVMDGSVTERIDIAMAAIDGFGLLDRVVPVLPGPSLIVGGGRDEDALETAALALGDVVRRLGESHPGTIALQEADPAGLEAASALGRIADHAGMTLVLLDGVADDRLAFPAEGDDGAAATMRIPGGTVPACGDLRVIVAAGERPETVLSALDALDRG